MCVDATATIRAVRGFSLVAGLSRVLHHERRIKIGRTLVITESTVKVHMKAIVRKSRLQKRQAANIGAQSRKRKRLDKSAGYHLGSWAMPSLAH
jgi:hypothetical protein